MGRQEFCGSSTKLCITLDFTEVQGSFNLPHTEDLDCHGLMDPFHAEVKPLLSSPTQPLPFCSLLSVFWLHSLFAWLAQLVKPSFANTPPHNIHQAHSCSFSKLSQMVRNLTSQCKSSSSITTHHFLFVRQLLLVLSHTVKNSCFLLICSVLCVVYTMNYIYGAIHTFMMPITDLLNDFGWIGCSKMLGHRPMHSEMTDELMCLTFGGLWCLISRAVEDSCQELTMLPITKSCIFCHSSFQCMFGIDFFVLFRS